MSTFCSHPGCYNLPHYRLEGAKVCAPKYYCELHVPSSVPLGQLTVLSQLSSGAKPQSGAKPGACAPDPVSHPPHYTSHPSGIECIEITRHMGFNLGNAIKYIWRADLKGKSVEDLKKAQWYIEDEIKSRTHD